MPPVNADSNCPNSYGLWLVVPTSEYRSVSREYRHTSTEDRTGTKKSSRVYTRLGNLVSKCIMPSTFSNLRSEIPAMASSVSRSCSFGSFEMASGASGVSYRNLVSLVCSTISSSCLSVIDFFSSLSMLLYSCCDCFYKSWSGDKTTVLFLERK